MPSVGGLKLKGVWGLKLEGEKHAHRQRGARVAARWLQGLVPGVGGLKLEDVWGLS